MLHHKSLIVDLHCFDDVPLGSILKKLGDMFLADEELKVGLMSILWTKKVERLCYFF